MNGLPEWGSGKVKGWWLNRELGRDQERSARALLLSALDASARGDLQDEVDAWTEDVDGFPAYGIILGAIGLRAASVIAASNGYELSALGAANYARERLGDYTQPPRGPFDKSVTLSPKDGKGSPLYFERAPHVGQMHGLPWADQWKLTDDPAKSTLPFDEKVKRTCSQCGQLVVECGHVQLEEKMGVVGEVPWDKPAEPEHVHCWDETPWGTECACGAKPEGGEEGKPAPSTAPCPPMRTVVPPGFQLVINGVDVPSDTVVATGDVIELRRDPTEAAPDSPAAVEADSPGPTSTDSHVSTPDAESAGRGMPESQVELAKAEADLKAEGYWEGVPGAGGNLDPDTGTPWPAASPGPQPEAPAPSATGGTSEPSSGDGLVSCEDCATRVKPSNTIVDGNQVRRCGDCHKANAIGLDSNAYCQEHPDLWGGKFRVDECPGCAAQRGVEPGPSPADDHGSVGSSSKEEGKRVVEICPGCDRNLIDGEGLYCADCHVAMSKPGTTVSMPVKECGAESPKTGKPCDRPRGHKGLHVGASFGSRIEPDAVCGACGHVGMSHDHRSKKCQACQLCTGFVARVDMPEVGPQHTIPPRWLVACPACPASMTTASDPTGKPCNDCGYRDPLVRLCSESSDASAFDWARFLTRHAELVKANQPRRCRICESPVSFGAKAWQHPKNKASIAHEGCVGDELGYAAVMLREGEVIEAELNEAAADRGEVKKEPCMVCSKDVEPGELCYAHGPPGQRTLAHYTCVEGKDAQPPIADGDERDACEWNPEHGRAAKPGDRFHSLAEVLVGTNEKSIRLCRLCRKLKPHTRLRKEVPIAAKADRQPAPLGA